MCRCAVLDCVSWVRTGIGRCISLSFDGMGSVFVFHARITVAEFLFFSFHWLFYIVIVFRGAKQCCCVTCCCRCVFFWFGFWYAVDRVGCHKVRKMSVVGNDATLETCLGGAGCLANANFPPVASLLPTQSFLRGSHLWGWDLLCADRLPLSHWPLHGLGGFWPINLPLTPLRISDWFLTQPMHLQRLAPSKGYVTMI